MLAAREPRRRPVLLANALVFYLVSSLAAATLTFTALLATDVGPAGVGAQELVILASGIVACAIGEVGYSFLLGMERTRELAYVTGCASWLYALLVFVLWAGPGLTVAGAALAWTATEAVRTLVLVSVSRRGGSIGNPSRRILVQEIGFGIRLWIGSLARFLNFRTDQILMGFLASEAALGYYAVAVNASEILLYLPSSAATALLPLIARTEAGPSWRRNAPRLPVGRFHQRDRGRRRCDPRAPGPAGRLRRCLRRVDYPLPLAPARNARLRGQHRLLQRARRLVLAGTFVAGADRLPRRRLRPRHCAHSALRRDGGGRSRERRVPGRRRYRPCDIPPRKPLRVAIPARAASRRPRRAASARRSPAAAGLTQHRMSGRATSVRR